MTEQFIARQWKVHFKDFLKSEKVNYIELPILDQDVVYYKRGLKKEAYALIKSGEYENVYITDSIPLDMNWDLLVKDCEAQKSGKAPMEMVTKAKRIVDKACNDATKSTDDLIWKFQRSQMQRYKGSTCRNGIWD